MKLGMVSITTTTVEMKKIGWRPTKRTMKVEIRGTPQLPTLNSGPRMRNVESGLKRYRKRKERR
jgi:hypothetical protein